MRRGVGTLVGVAVAAVLLTACQSTIPLQPTGSGQPTPQGTAPAGADLYGSVRFDDHSQFTNPPDDPNGNGDDGLLVTVNVALKRDPGNQGEFVDAGSTYTLRQESHRDVRIGIDPNTCRGHSSTSGGASNKKFSDPPSAADDPGSTISAIYDPALHFFTLNVDVWYELTQILDACMAGQNKTIVSWTGGPLLCGLGLNGAYVDVAGGPDEFDMACFVANPNRSGGVTVSGTITIRE